MSLPVLRVRWRRARVIVSSCCCYSRQLQEPDEEKAPSYIYISLVSLSRVSSQRTGMLYHGQASWTRRHGTENVEACMSRVLSKSKWSGWWLVCGLGMMMGVCEVSLVHEKICVSCCTCVFMWQPQFHSMCCRWVPVCCLARNMA